MHRRFLDQPDLADKNQTGATNLSKAILQWNFACRSQDHKEGYQGLYKGIVPALILTSNGAIQFVIYEELKQRFIKPDISILNQGFSIHYFFMGAFSKAIASTLTYPYQVVKSRIQQRQIGKSLQYRGIIQSFILIIRNEGVIGIYKGLGANLLRVMPHSALTFVVYEFCKKHTG